jgi:hypothetical protein
MSEMINWVTSDSTGVARFVNFNELPTLELPAIREFRVIVSVSRVIRLTEREAKKFLRAGGEITVIDHRPDCVCLYCKMMRDPVESIKRFAMRLVLNIQA